MQDTITRADIAMLMSAVSHLQAQIEELHEATALATRIGFNQTEAAKVVGVSRETLCRDTKAGIIRPGHRGIYSRAALEAYAQGLSEADSAKRIR